MVCFEVSMFNHLIFHYLNRIIIKSHHTFYFLKIFENLIVIQL